MCFSEVSEIQTDIQNSKDNSKNSQTIWFLKFKLILKKIQEKAFWNILAFNIDQLYLKITLLHFPDESIYGK